MIKHYWSYSGCLRLHSTKRVSIWFYWLLGSLNWLILSHLMSERISLQVIDVLVTTSIFRKTTWFQSFYSWNCIFSMFFNHLLCFFSRFKIYNVLLIKMVLHFLFILIPILEIFGIIGQSAILLCFLKLQWKWRMIDLDLVRVWCIW